MRCLELLGRVTRDMAVLLDSRLPHRPRLELRPKAPLLAAARTFEAAGLPLFP